MIEKLKDTFSKNNLRKNLGQAHTQKIFQNDLIILFLIFLNSIIYILQTYNLNAFYLKIINISEISLVLIFTIEIFLRFFSSKNRIDFFKNKYNWIDIIAILPFWFGLTNLQILRSLRFLKVFRYSNKYLTNISYKSSKNIEKIFVFRIIFITIIILYFASSLILHFEKDMNLAINNFGDAFYFTLVTISTVGFGDVVTQTIYGKITTMVVIFIGFLIIPINTGFLIKHIVFSNSKVKTICHKCHLVYHDRDSRYCKNCGTKIFITERSSQIDIK
jgi:voltage-gated potassium channel